MSCYHPLHGFKIGLTEKGKALYQIESGKTEWIHPKQGNKIVVDKIIKDYIEIPCGQCIGCRLDYSRQWADRCMLEAKEHEHNYMITLTYNDEHLTYKNKINEDGEILYKTPSLKPDDLSIFMKNLRRYYKYHYNIDKIKFYGCGEYGSQTERPHFHIIVYDCPIYDLKCFFKNAVNEWIYLSDTIEKIWAKGQITVTELTWNSAAYVARYVTKKIKGQNATKYYDEKNQEPEFVRMSRNPGIGKNYYDNHKEEIYNTDEIIILKKGLPTKIKPAKYYDKLYDIENPEHMEEIKKQRLEIAKNTMLNQLQKTDKTKEEYLLTKEYEKLQQIRSLIRTN